MTLERVSLYEVFGHQIVTRSSISRLFDILTSSVSRKFCLDFSNIEFISRSCADEYLKRKLQEIRKELVEINVAEDVMKMFDLVKSQRRQDIGLATISA